MKSKEIDRIECAIRHIESSLDVDPWAVEIAVEAMEKQREALNMAISALQAQEAKTQLSAEGTTSDLISRRAAIDRIVWWFGILKQNPDILIDSIKTLPSAHSEIEKRKEESAQNVPKEDLISRKAAIDSLGERPMVWTDDDQYALGERNQYDMNRLAIETLPSAQPEPQWVPVSERLPEEYGNYLISIHGEDEPDIGTINPNDKRGWSLCDANGFHWASDKELIVTAWMPLPEPYRAERRTDDE